MFILVGFKEYLPPHCPFKILIKESCFDFVLNDVIIIQAMIWKCSSPHLEVLSELGGGGNDVNYNTVDFSPFERRTSWEGELILGQEAVFNLVLPLVKSI